MTPRMKEIAEQSFSEAYRICKENGREGGDSDHIWVTIAMATLAESITKECIDTINQAKKDANSYEEVDVLSWVETTIKNKLGVK